MRLTTEENPIEVEANKVGLNYVDLDGNVGCMVNGARSKSWCYPLPSGFNWI